MSSPSDLAFRLRPDPSSAQPLYLQLTAALAEEIGAGRIAVGTCLPSERRYARQLGVSRTTVTAAYQELKSRGLLRGYVGRGAIVVANDADHAARGAIAWSQLGARRTRSAAATRGAQSAGVISFGDGWLHRSLVPGAALSAAAARALLEPELLCRAEPLRGSPALRTALMASLDARGVRLEDEELLVTGGAQQGLNVIARALLSPGDSVVCENPTWHGAVAAFRAVGAEVWGIDMDHEGIDPDALEDALVRVRPKLIYVIPSFQCPTGKLMSLARRRRILEIAARYRTPLIESHVYGDLAFGERLPSLKSLDPAGIVIHQGSASKTVSPALRLGWLVAPRPAIELLAAAKGSLDLSTASLPQAVLASLLASGAYGRHLPWMCSELRARRDSLTVALATHCPELRCTPPLGGLYLWVQLPPGVVASEVEAVAAVEGVAVRAGSAFLTTGAGSSFLRLCFAAPAVEQIGLGVQRLGVALQSVLQRHREAGVRPSALASV